MWLFTTVGFFSVVQKGAKGLVVRARVKDDLERLRDKMPGLGEIIEGGGTDYPYRAEISHEDYAQGLAQIAREIDYSNFKDAVAKRMGYKRANYYTKVWSIMAGLKE